MSFHLIFLFLANIRKNLKLEKLENMMKKQNIKKKRYNPSKKAFLKISEGAKYPGGSRVSC